jgi:hypothetical protein
MATKVRSETIKKIATMGMARALKEAETSTDPEFKEAIRRYYPKAKFGAKTAAQASTDEKTQQTAANKDDVTFNKTQKASVSPGVHKAVRRRVDPATGGTKTVKPTYARNGEQNNKPRPSDGSRQAFGRGLKEIGSWFSPNNSPEASAARKAKRQAELKRREGKLRNRTNSGL